jgi:hypothetical protein
VAEASRRYDDSIASQANRMTENLNTSKSRLQLDSSSNFLKQRVSVLPSSKTMFYFGAQAPLKENTQLLKLIMSGEGVCNLRVSLSKS